LVVLTNYATAQMREHCIKLGANRVFDKSNEFEAFLEYCARLANGETRPSELSWLGARRPSIERDDLRLMLNAACLEWQKRCSAFLNSRAEPTTGAKTDETQLESARAETRRALADFFGLVKQIDQG
jgi:hypothetical protein